MPSGFEMMLKSMGFDPEKIKQTLTESRDTIMKQVDQINAKLDVINLKLNEVLYPVKDSEKPADEGGHIDSPHDVSTKVN
jgi:hypothetical protein